MSYIFISHVEEDAHVALEIAIALEEAGYRTWFYEIDSVPGPSHILRTGEAVAQSEAIMVLISPNSLSSNQVTKEIVRAHESNKHFIPVLLNITHVEFQNRQPEWREAIGSATSIRIPTTGVATIIPAIFDGIRALGLHNNEKPDTARIGRMRRTLNEIKTSPTIPASTPLPAAKPADAKTAKPNKTRFIIMVSTLVIVVVLAAILLPRLLGNGKSDQELSSLTTSTPPTFVPSTFAPTTPVPPTPPPATPPPTTPPAMLQPDLGILSVAWSPQSPSAGETVTFNVAIVNQGKAVADSSYLHFYIDDVYTNSIQIPKLSTGATITKTFDWIAQLGAHTYRYAADNTSLVSESDETNNIKETSFSITLQPDLIVTDITWSPINPTYGKIVNVTVTFKNQGNGSAAPSNLDCSYRGSPFTSSENKHVVLPIPTVPAGGTAIKTVSFTYWGTESFEAISDCTHLLPESNENNNAKNVTF